MSVRRTPPRRCRWTAAVALLAGVALLPAPAAAVPAIGSLVPDELHQLYEQTVVPEVIAPLNRELEPATSSLRSELGLLGLGPLLAEARASLPTEALAALTEELAPHLGPYHVTAFHYAIDETATTVVTRTDVVGIGEVPTTLDVDLDGLPDLLVEVRRDLAAPQVRATRLPTAPAQLRVHLRFSFPPDHEFGLGNGMVAGWNFPDVEGSLRP